mgnify:CR=1 FL=1
MDYKEALAAIQADAAKKEKFYRDPKGELEALGVDTSNLKIEKTSGQVPASRISVCVQVGELVGASVGT